MMSVHKKIVLGLFANAFSYLYFYYNNKLASSKHRNSLIAPSKFKGADIALGWVNDGDGKVHLYDMKAIGNSAPKVRP